MLTVLAFGAGWATGWASGAGATERFTVGMVFVVRNVGIATAIAVTALGRVEFAVFATAYFLAQMLWGRPRKAQGELPMPQV